MLTISLKKRPLSRYLKDYKHSQTHCCQCGKLLGRMVLALRGKIINKEAIAAMVEPIDDHLWLDIQQDLSALCRFCSEVTYKTQATHFDIMAFKQYLFEQTEMSHSSIREYIVRLVRLDEMLVVHHASTKFTVSQWQTADELPLPVDSNYRIALRKYYQFLAWQNN